MLHKDFYITRKDGVNLYRSYSDNSMKIRQIDTGILYDEAIDVENTPHTYEETEIPIEVYEQPEPLLETTLNNVPEVSEP